MYVYNYHNYKDRICLTSKATGSETQERLRKPSSIAVSGTQ